MEYFNEGYCIAYIYAFYTHFRKAKYFHQNYLRKLFFQNQLYIHFHSATDKITAKLDRTQLIRVITNLVKNAIQAIPQERIPAINVSVGIDGKNVFIQVKDNGIGITDENKERIYEPKFTTKTSGMGLGLGMVKNIVETYKGSITFTSEENIGTEFTVNFPKE